MAKDTGTAEAKKPETEREVDFTGAAGVNDAPEKKKDVTADQPAFQENPANAAAEEEKAKKAKKAGEELNLGQNNDQQAEEQPKPKKDPEAAAETPIHNMPVPSGISQKDMEAINDAWGVPNITKAFDESLQGSTINFDKGAAMMSFKLANNSNVTWFDSYQGVRGFIGFPKNKKMDDLDAKMVVGALASQGKKEIRLFGNRESKEKMWLEAMRQGLTVTNFQPIASNDPNSVYQKWLREMENHVTGAAADPNAVTPETPADKPAETAPETATAEKPAVETPPAEKAEAEKPAEAAANTATADKPAEDKPTEDKPAGNKPVAAETEAKDAKAEDVKAEAPAKETPAAEESAPEKPAGVKSSFLAEKPAAAEAEAKDAKAEDVKAEAPAKETPAAEEKAPEKPATKSAFIGDTTTDKKDAAPAPTPPEVPRNESFEETLARRIEQTKNPKIEAALRTLKAELDNGNLKLDGMNRELVHGKLSGSKPLSVKSVNAAIGYAAGLPENKGVVLPTVDDNKPNAPQQKRQPGLG